MKKVEIQKELLYIGIKPSLKGFDYIATAIELYDVNKKLTDLYIQVAEKYNTKASRVERAIRNAKELMLNDNIETLEERICKKYGVDKVIPDKFTNGDFIAFMKFAIENMEASHDSNN